MVHTINLLAQDTYPIRTHAMVPQHDMELHQHDNLELVVITGGQGAHVTETGSYPLRRGDVFMVPIGMAHGFAHTRRLTLVNLGYDPERLELPMHRLRSLPGYEPLVALEPRLRRQHRFAGHLHLGEEDLVPLEQQLRELSSELQRQEPGWQHAAGACLLQILVRLARWYARQETPEARLAVRIGAVMRHIEEHLAAPLDLEALCQLSRMSPSTLQRAFRAGVGRSVVQHVLATRLQAARELLLATDLAVGEIAVRVGIPDPNYFARLFRSKVGVTPRAFRWRQRQAHTHPRPHPPLAG